MRAVAEGRIIAYCRMLNCRSVSPGVWEHAWQALVFYFSRRHGRQDAEDLAQETLTSVLKRDDFQFEKEEEFLKVCYAFAAHILQEARRKSAKLPGAPLDPDRPAVPSQTQGLQDSEIRVYLSEVLRLGEEELRKADWELIQRSVVLSGSKDASASSRAEANNLRVKLHRARAKLARLAGWRKG